MKMRGEGKSPPRVSLKEILVSWVGAFLGIFAVGYLGHLVQLEQQDILFLIGSFGASAVLLYRTPGVPLAQPRNLMGGHILSALTGVLMYGWIADPLYLSEALSVATAIAVMHLTKTTHPPGGATTLIGVILCSGVKQQRHPKPSGAQISDLLLNHRSDHRLVPSELLYFLKSLIDMIQQGFKA